MENLTVQIEVKLATDLREFIDPMILLKRIGMVYFQRLTNGDLVHRTITEDTDRRTLLDLIASRRAYIPTKTILSEKS